MVETATDRNETGYILGHSEREIRRLMLQASILRPTTERLLRGAGISQGMRVLDLGCGAGDVAMLAGELVGRSGSVVGIDRNRDAVAVAKGRALVAGLRHVRFEENSVKSYSATQPFDVVVGRYVLVHQADPVAFIQAAANLARPEGFVAFHEPGTHGPLFRSYPSVPLWLQVGDWIQTALQAAVPEHDAGCRLIELFSRAGLPQPTLFCESPVGGGKDSPLYAWASETVKSVLPQLARIQVMTADEGDIETLEARLRDAVVEARSQIVGPAQFCAWTRV